MFKRLVVSVPAAAVAVLCLTMPLSELAASDDLPHFGLGVSAGTLGIGVQAATGVARKSNVRFGFNAFTYNNSFDKDGVRYDGSLKLRSAQVTFDQYVAGSFHISPGILLYNGNKGSANASVPGGQSFTLGDMRYYSNAANPIAGAGDLILNKVAPMILVGLGNMLPRSQRHFGLNFDIGVVFQGSPKVTLKLAGTACLTPTAGCVNAATDAGVQASVRSEQTKINNDLTPFKYYPVVALTFSYKF
jgi:hypothetical protein